jgi:XapX domain-containing protein
MKTYLISLGAGLLVGVVYSLLNVRSPAPPLVALIGLLGILIGEQIVPMGAKLLAGNAIRTAWRQSHCEAHLFGQLPGANTATAECVRAPQPREPKSKA